MTAYRLTEPHHLATSPAMDGGDDRRGRWVTAAVLLAGGIALSGCVRVEAPDKPIVIELNINIKQEVIYRLAEDAGNTIEENAEIF